MQLTFEALFDGLAFRPLEPLDGLTPHTRVQITLTVADGPSMSGAAISPETAITDADTSTFPSQEELARYIAENYVNSPFYRTDG
jgi:hypothetical protein